VTELRTHPAVLMVDDDLDWLAQAGRLLALVRATGLALSGLLLGAAIFTIASVVRLILLLYRDEIAVQRLVGATEFFVRGPFYVQGLLQGFVGAVGALAALALIRLVLLANLGPSLAAELLLSRFLGWPQQLVLVAIGALAGFGGAILSVRREVAGEPGTS
jgi:cell division transport system permease protein